MLLWASKGSFLISLLQKGFQGCKIELCFVLPQRHNGTQKRSTVLKRPLCPLMHQKCSDLRRHPGFSVLLLFSQKTVLVQRKMDFR